VHAAANRNYVVPRASLAYTSEDAPVRHLLDDRTSPTLLQVYFFAFFMRFFRSPKTCLSHSHKLFPTLLIPSLATLPPPQKPDSMPSQPIRHNLPPVARLPQTETLIQPQNDQLSSTDHLTQQSPVDDPSCEGPQL
jgi:hypothetical protein